MKLSVITTLYYSEPFIKDFFRRTIAEVKKITTDYEFIFVNDGSPDLSTKVVLELQELDPNIILIDLSRNFGHQKALITGLKYTQGDYVFMIDSDLEEDPELLSSFWNELQESPQLDVVYGVQSKRKGDWFEKISGKLYYSFFSLLSKHEYPANSLTARLMTRQYVLSLNEFEEKESDLWGVFVLTGFQQKGIIVNKGYKGRSTYTLRRKVGMAIATITTLSHRPLYLIIITGFIITLVSLLFAITMVIDHFINGDADRWWVTLISIWLLGGLMILSIGVLGVYISKMFLEIKNRPFSIIKKIYSKKK